jgi:hypothetical protein
VQLTDASSDGIAIQPRDAGHQGDTTAAVLLGEEADEQAARTLIRQSNESIDATVLLCRGAVRLLLATWAMARVQHSPGVLLVHWRFSPWNPHKRTNVFYQIPDSAEVIFAH